MKKLLLLSAFAATFSTATAQNTIFQDGFETYNDFIITNIGQYTLYDNDLLGTYIGGVATPPPGSLPWTNAYAKMACQVFNPATAGVQNGFDNENSNFNPHTGNKYIAFWAGSPAAPVTKNDDWLVLPKMKLGLQNKFSFWVKSLADNYGLEKFKVAIYDGTAGAPANSTAFTVLGSTSRTAPITWTEVIVDIPTTYDNKQVYLAINYISADVYMMLVDDVKVTTTSILGVSQTAEKQNSTVFPNPSKGLFNLKSSKKTTSVEVYTVDGKRIKTEKSAQSVDLTNQSKGVYILKVNYEDGSTDSNQVIKN